MIFLASLDQNDRKSWIITRHTKHKRCDFVDYVNYSKNKDLYYFPDPDHKGFSLIEDTIEYEILEFDGDLPILDCISDGEAEAIDEFFSVFCIWLCWRNILSFWKAQYSNLIDL